MRRILAGALWAILLPGCMGGDDKFPEDYLLYGSEIPSGLRLADVPPGEEMPNPGQVPLDELDDEEYAQFGAYKPQEAWKEAFAVKSGTESDEVGIVAAYFEKAETVEQAVAQFKAMGAQGFCGQQDFKVFYEGHVLVIVWGDEAGNDYVDDVADAIGDKNSGLKDLCA